MAGSEFAARLIWESISRKPVEPSSEPDPVSATKEKKKIFRGRSNLKPSIDQISSPILDGRYPILVHTPLIPLGTLSPTTPSAEDLLSSPIPDERYPNLLHTTLIPLWQVSPTTSSAVQSLSSPISPRAPVTRTTAIPSSPETPCFQPTHLPRWNSEPVASVDTSLIPSCGDADLVSWISDPERSHAFPSLQSPITRISTPATRLTQLSDTNSVPPTFPAPDFPPTPPVTPSTLGQHGYLRVFSGISRNSSRTNLRTEVETFTPQSAVDCAPARLSKIFEASPEKEFPKAQKVTQRLFAIMEPGRVSLQPPANTGTKLRAIQQAKETENLVAERAKRTGDEPPPYEFFELIGKGAYGRVFKGRNRNSGSLVAIKIIDTDKTDYEEMTTKNLQETLREINILQQLKDSKARPYVNIIEEARTVHNELWIISEYASGGSVNTLMKPRMNLPNKGLEEKYIIPIARELALGLKFVHEAGVIHRDLKSNNILILEDGRVQLCDFGVSGALEPEITKRSTIVGTPNWMAPELKREWVKDIDPNRGLRPQEILYGSEVDIWAYGCTIYEMATGLPPFHTTKPFLLPDAGVLQLEGDHYSDELKDLVSFVLQPDPRERPTAERILEHPYLVDSTETFPTVTLVALVEQYYRWEQAGGSRVSLFNPYGAQAPDPLAPEPEDEDADWTFSTSDEFDRRHSSDDMDPFAATAVQDFAASIAPPEDDSRFAKLQASIRAEQADRGKRRLDRLFDTTAPAYRLSAHDLEPQRPLSDLVLRDFNPGAPNRETVIDLDFAAPTVVDVPSIDLGEVPTVKANRLNRLMRDMELEEEEEDVYYMDQTAKRATRDWKFPAMAEDDMDQTAKRATRDWKFPAMTEPPAEEQSNRRTVDWKFPAMPEKPNRRTMEWTFDASMAESNIEPVPNISRLSRMREPKEPLTMRPNDNRRTQDFVFPMRDPEDEPEGGLSSSPTLAPGFRPTLRHATTEPLGTFDDFPRIASTPESPMQSSMIDLDMAMVDDFRPSTSGSASTSVHTAGFEQSNGNPFDLEDQVHLSETNNRASYHMKSQSEPNHAIPGLLTPQAFDEQGKALPQDLHLGLHARGVSSASQMQNKQAPPSITFPRQRSRQEQHYWDAWSHHDAFLCTDESSPISISPATSIDDEPTLDDRWAQLTAQTQYQRRQQQLSHASSSSSQFRNRRTTSTDDEPRSDADDPYASESYDEYPASLHRRSRVSVGPNGRPLVEFPVPCGPDVHALSGGLDADPSVLSQALWSGAVEMKNGLGAARDLLRSFRLATVEESEEDGH